MKSHSVLRHDNRQVYRIFTWYAGQSDTTTDHSVCLRYGQMEGYTVPRFLKVYNSPSTLAVTCSREVWKHDLTKERVKEELAKWRKRAADRMLTIEIKYKGS